jgi:macrolide-specific efflux system membrane fusion protein
MNVQPRLRTAEQRPAPAPSFAPAKRVGFFGRIGKFIRRRPLLTILLAAIFALGVTSAVLYRGAGSTATPIIATAARGDIENLVSSLGTLQPIASVDVGAQVSGQLKKLYVLVGNDVQKDELLAEIDSSVMAAKVDAGKAQLQNLQAQLAEKESQLALATTQADRQTRLKADNATSQDAYDSAQAALRAAQAQVKAVEAQIIQSQSTLKADEATLSYSKISAPTAGTVSNIPAKEGQTLNANQQTPTILTIADLSTMTVYTQVSEADVPKLRVGIEAYFTTLGSGNRRWSGKLRQILPTPTVVNNVVLYTALFDVANPGKELMTQMTAQVFFVLDAAHDVITVPVSALNYTDRPAARTPAAQGAAAVQAGGRADGAARGGRGRGGRGGQAQTDESAVTGPAPARTRPATVVLVHEDGSQETRSVVVGVTDRVSAEIVSGLSEGEKVVAGEASDTGASRAGRGGNAGRGRGPVLFGG